MNIDDIDVKRLSLKKGDVVVVKVRSLLSEDKKMKMRSRLENVFPDNECIILLGGMDIEVICG